MQSPQIQSVHTLDDIIAAMYRACLTTNTVQITAVTGEYFEITGDFSEFIFTDNPANSLEKRLTINDIEHKKCVLISESVVRVPIADGFTPVLDENVVVADGSPFLYIGTKKELNLVQLKQPAFAFFAPTNEQVEGGQGSTLTKSARIIILLSDLSKDYGWTDKFTGALDEMTQPKFAQYILRPLELFATKFIMLLSDGFTYQPAGSNLVTTVNYADQERRATITAVRRIGRDDESNVKAGFGYTDNTSGIFLQMDIVLNNSICVKE